MFVSKIGATVAFWCIAADRLPRGVPRGARVPTSTQLHVRSHAGLGWAHLALCVGHAFGLGILFAAIAPLLRSGPASSATMVRASISLLRLHGRMGPRGPFVPSVLWSSAAATAAITWWLHQFGLRAGEAGQRVAGDARNCGNTWLDRRRALTAKRTRREGARTGIDGREGVTPSRIAGRAARDLLRRRGTAALQTKPAEGRP